MAHNKKGLASLTGKNGDEGDKFVIFSKQRESIWVVFANNLVIAKRYH